MKIVSLFNTVCHNPLFEIYPVKWALFRKLISLFIAPGWSIIPLPVITFRAASALNFIPANGAEWVPVFPKTRFERL
jgi:hypothetical protein